MYMGCVCLLRLSERLDQSAKVQGRLVSSVRRMSVLSHIRGAQYVKGVCVCLVCQSGRRDQPAGRGSTLQICLVCWGRG